MITAGFSFWQFDSGSLLYIRAHIGKLRPREYPWGAEILKGATSYRGVAPEGWILLGDFHPQSIGLSQS